MSEQLQALIEQSTQVQAAEWISNSNSRDQDLEINEIARGNFMTFFADDAEESLVGEDFSGVKMHDSDLSGANLEGVKFLGSDLTGFSFHGAHLRLATFDGAKMKGVTFSESATFLPEFEILGAAATYVEGEHVVAVHDRTTVLLLRVDRSRPSSDRQADRGTIGLAHSKQPSIFSRFSAIRGPEQAHLRDTSFPSIAVIGDIAAVAFSGAYVAVATHHSGIAILRRQDPLSAVNELSFTGLGIEADRPAAWTQLALDTSIPSCGKLLFSPGTIPNYLFSVRESEIGILEARSLGPGASHPDGARFGLHGVLGLNKVPPLRNYLMVLDAYVSLGLFEVKDVFTDDFCRQLEGEQTIGLLTEGWYQRARLMDALNGLNILDRFHLEIYRTISQRMGSLYRKYRTAWAAHLRLPIALCNVEHLLTIAVGHKVFIWNCLTGDIEDQLSLNLKKHDVVSCLKVSSRGVMASGTSCGIITIWDTEHAQEFRLTGEGSGTVTTLDFSTDTETLVVGGCDGTIHIWSLATRSLVDVLLAHRDRIVTLEFFSNSDYFFSVGSGRSDGLRIWSLRDQRATNSWKARHLREVKTVGYANSSRGRTFSSVDGNGSIHLWDVHEGHLAEVNHRSSLVSCSYPSASVFPHDLVQWLWAAPPPVRLEGHESEVGLGALSPPSAHQGLPDGCRVLAWSSDCTRVALADKGGRNCLWKVNLQGSSDLTYGFVDVLPVDIECLAWSPLRNVLLVGITGYKGVLVYDVTKHSVVHQECPLKSCPLSCRFITRSDVAVIFADPWIDVVDVSGEIPRIRRAVTLDTPAWRRLRRRSDRVVYDALPDGRMVGGNSVGEVLLWDDDCQTGRTAWISVHPINGICFSPDGGHVITGGQDSLIQCWFVDWNSLDTGSEPLSLCWRSHSELCAVSATLFDVHNLAPAQEYLLAERGAVVRREEFTTDSSSSYTAASQKADSVRRVFNRAGCADSLGLHLSDTLSVGSSGSASSSGILGSPSALSNLHASSGEDDEGRQLPISGQSGEDDDEWIFALDDDLRGSPISIGFPLEARIEPVAQRVSTPVPLRWTGPSSPSSMADKPASNRPISSPKSFPSRPARRESM